MIDFDCGWGYVEDMGKCEFGVEMFYDRMDVEDKKRIVFKEGSDTRGNDDVESYARKKYGNWRRAIEGYLGADQAAREDGGRSDLVPYIASIYGASLDSELPGLEYDVEKREISFDWEGLLERFCREYKEVMKRHMEVVPRVQAMARRTDTSTLNGGFFEMMTGALEAIVGNRRAARRDVRRLRIQKFYKEKHGFDMKARMIDKEHEREQLRRIEDAEEAEVGKDSRWHEEDEDASDVASDDEQDDDMIDAEISGESD